MDKIPPKNMGASVHARLLNLSRDRKEDFNWVLTRFALERYLFRLSRSEHSTQFIVKGATLFSAWMPAELGHRPTRDIDLLGHGSPDEGRLEKMFCDVCNVSMSDDGIVFDVATVKAVAIMPQEKYRGIRIELFGKLTSAKIKLQIDVGFGGEVCPAPVLTTFPTLLPFESPQMKGYQRDTSIAEKFQAMVELGVTNSRMKDFFDISVLSRNFEFEAEVLWQAIVATFTRRETALPVELPMALTPEFSEESNCRQWASFVKRSFGGRTQSSFTLPEAVTDIRAFLWPLCQRAAEGVPYGHWVPGGPWKFEAGSVVPTATSKPGSG